MGVFGSIQTGSATGFSSKGRPQEGSQYSPDVSRANLERLHAPAEYQGLKVGPEFVVEYEPNQAAPLDGNKDLLRSLSPFMIQVEPPLIVGSGNAQYPEKKDVAGIFLRLLPRLPLLLELLDNIPVVANRLRHDFLEAPPVTVERRWLHEVVRIARIHIPLRLLVIGRDSMPYELM